MYWEVHSATVHDDGIKHLLNLNPSKLQKITIYALFYYSVIITLISGEFYIISTGIFALHNSSKWIGLI